MRIDTVHLRHGGLDPDRDLVLVKEGFSWPAAIFSVLWALWNRLWAASALFLGLDVALQAGLAWIEASETVAFVLTLALAVAFGMVGNDLRRAALRRRGFAEVAVAAGADRLEAERRFVEASPRLAAEMGIA